MAITRATFPPTATAIASAVTWVRRRLPAWVDPVVELGLSEAVTNVVVHGGCRVSPAGRNDLDAIEETSTSAEGRGPPFEVEVLGAPDAFAVTLRWEGMPYPVEHRRPPSDLDPRADSGRGMSIIYGCFDEVRWGATGRSLTLSLRQEKRPRDGRGVPTLAEHGGGSGDEGLT